MKHTHTHVKKRNYWFKFIFITVKCHVQSNNIVISNKTLDALQILKHEPSLTPIWLTDCK